MGIHGLPPFHANQPNFGDTPGPSPAEINKVYGEINDVIGFGLTLSDKICSPDTMGRPTPEDVTNYSTAAWNASEDLKSMQLEYPKGSDPYNALTPLVKQLTNNFLTIRNIPTDPTQLSAGSLGDTIMYFNNVKGGYLDLYPSAVQPPPDPKN